MIVHRLLHALAWCFDEQGFEQGPTVALPLMKERGQNMTTKMVSGEKALRSLPSLSHSLRAARNAFGFVGCLAMAACASPQDTPPGFEYTKSSYSSANVDPSLSRSVEQHELNMDAIRCRLAIPAFSQRNIEDKRDRMHQCLVDFGWIPSSAGAAR